MALLFAVLVLTGFGFWWLATWPVQYAERIARALFFFTSLVWFLSQVGVLGLK